MAVTVASSSEIYTTGVSGIITKPSGVAAGDMLLLVCFGKWNDTYSAACTGFTTITNSTDGGENLSALYRIADSSDVSATNYTVTNGQTEVMICYMLRITGMTTDVSQFTKQTGVGDGIFNTLDITPNYANSLIVFAQWNVPYTGNDLAGWAIATSNPTWTTAQSDIGNGPNSFGPSAIVWAVRPELTNTGDFSITDPGTAQKAFAIVLAPVLSVTASPSVITSTLAVQAPAVSAGATVSTSVISKTIAVQAPTVTLTAPKWVNTDKSSAGTITNTPKS